MSEKNYVEYVTHMLDESMSLGEDLGYGHRHDRKDLGDRSYYSVWAKEFPRYANPTSLRHYLAALFDNHMRKIDDLPAKLHTYFKLFSTMETMPYEKTSSCLLTVFGSDGLTDRQAFWQPIPARVYKAIVSRELATAQGRMSRGVSPRVLKDCLDTICRSAAIIQVHDTDMSTALSRTRTYKLALRACEFDGGAANTIVNDMYLAFSSFTTPENGKAYNSVYDEIYAKYPEEDRDDVLDNHFDEFVDMQRKAERTLGAGEWLCNSSDGEIGMDCLDEMKTVPYDVYERPTEAIPLISKLIDWSHIRGDVAGAFVEGGAPTCQAVSDMRPDELYERTAISR